MIDHTIAINLTVAYRDPQPSFSAGTRRFLLIPSGFDKRSGRGEDYFPQARGVQMLCAGMYFRGADSLATCRTGGNQLNV